MVLAVSAPIAPSSNQMTDEPGIDDFTAKEMGAEMIVHYGHSCLSKLTLTRTKRAV